MSTMTVYGIANCDTVKRARTALDAAGIAYAFHDFRKDGLDEARVKRWADAVGLDTLVNRRGTTWRQLPANTQESIETGDLTPLVEQPTLIKRPVIETDDGIIVGFAKKDADAILAKLSPN